jgi:ABC-2 family transporter protein
MAICVPSYPILSRYGTRTRAFLGAIRLRAMRALTYASFALGPQDIAKTLAVARFEIMEALRSRGVALLVLVYGVGALISSHVFLRVLHAAETQALDMLAEQMNTPGQQLPADLVRENAMPWLVQLVDDPSIREQLLQMDPLSIFMGFAALQVVPFMALFGSAGCIAHDVSSGAVRFVLFRCDRLAWALGKTAGQAALMAGGLLLSALVASAVGTWSLGTFDAERLLWLLRTAFRAWVFGVAYLGLFCGVSMISSTSARARALGGLLWTVVSIGHAVLTSDWLPDYLGPARHLAWLAPSHHQSGLWSASWSTYLTSVGCLLALASLGFAGGYNSFRRRDA